MAPALWRGGKRARVSRGNTGTDNLKPAGLPHARIRREGLGSSSVAHHERQKVPANSLEESPTACSAPDPQPDGSAGCGSRTPDRPPAGSWKEAAVLLASAASLLAPEAKQASSRPAREDLLSKLDELERRLRAHESGGSAPQIGAGQSPEQTQCGQPKDEGSPVMAGIDTGIHALEPGARRPGLTPGRDPGAGMAQEPSTTALGISGAAAAPAHRLVPEAGGFTSLAAIEHSIRELSAKVEETRRAVAALLAPNGQAPEQGSPSAGTNGAILEAIADLRALHEETASRASIAWDSIQTSLEHVAGLCARLEAAMTDKAALSQGGAPGADDPFAPLLARLTQLPGERAFQLAGASSARQDAGQSPEGARMGSPEAFGAADLSGFLIEPGAGRPGRDGAYSPSGAFAPTPGASVETGAGASRAGFIAAARRAARTAQLQAEGTGGRAGDDPGIETTGQNKRASFIPAGLGLAAPRRPLAIAVLAAGAVFLAAVLGARPVYMRVNRFLPALVKQFYGAAESKIPARAETAPPLGSRRGTAGALLPAAAPAGAPSGAAGAIAAAPLPTGPQLAAPAQEGAARPAAPILSSNANAKGEAHPPAASGSVPSASPPAGAPSGNPAGDLLARAKAGDPAAQFELAAVYAADASAPGNLALAAEWYEKAAGQGHAVAEYRLASLYEKGHGVAKDVGRAKELYQRAAEKGNIRAMHNLGVIAAEGNDGKPNYAGAALWFGKAAGYGIKDSQYNLAVLLARGLGVTKDLVRSYTWFAIVAAAGDEEAARKRDEVATRLTSSELASAKAAAAAFVPRTPDREANEPASPPSTAGASKAAPLPPKANLSGL